MAVSNRLSELSSHIVRGLYNPDTFCDPFLVGGVYNPDLSSHIVGGLCPPDLSSHIVGGVYNPDLSSQIVRGVYNPDTQKSRGQSTPTRKQNTTNI